MNDKRGRGLSGATLLVCVILLFAALWFTNQIDQRDKQITYQDFESLVENEEIAEVTIIQNRNVPTGRLEVTVNDAQEGDEAKLVYIISDHAETIAQRIMDELEAGVTFLRGKGAYSNSPKDVILCVMRNTVAPKAEEIVKQEDPLAFMIISSATEIYGEGYKNIFSEKL